ncbi:MAG: AMP-binding protein [bacterium]|nr:AMP-binding protein [bacterium]
MHPLDLIQKSCAAYPNTTALRALDATGVAYTYSQLHHRIDTIAAQLIRDGVRPGSRIALSAENHPNWGASYFGILAAGATVVPFDGNLPPNEVQFILTDSSACAWFGSETVFQRFSNIANEFLGIKYSIHDTFSSEYSASHLRSIPMAEVASLIYTSGTTGVAKGVMLSGESLATNALGAGKRYRIDNTDRVLSVLPLYHTFECTCGFIFPLSVGASVAYARSLKPNELVQDAQLIRPTLFIAVPLLLEKIRNGVFRKAREASPLKRMLFETILKASYATTKLPGSGLGVSLLRSVRARMGFDQIRFLVSGGAALPHSVNRDLCALGFPLIQGYGLTECGPLVSANSLVLNRAGSVGQVFEFNNVKIDNPDADGVGMLLVRGPNVMKGYWNNPTATADAFTPDGWLRTGDLASIDADGYLSIVGRRKDVIVTAGGKNVYPETLEQAILEDNRVLECVVVGRSRRTGNGEEIGAILVLNPDWLATESADGREYDDNGLQRIAVDIVAAVNEGQPDYRKITRIEVSKDELEKTSTRKIRRFKYRQ